MTKPYSVFSSVNTLQVYFVTKTGRRSHHSLDSSDDMPTSQQGFLANFQMGNKFVDLSRIDTGVHIEGTECDRLIRSRGQSEGTLASPYYPDHFPGGIVCHYYVDGLVDKQDLENVQFTLEDLDLGLKISNKCTAGSLKIYSTKDRLNDLEEQKDSEEVVAPNAELCGQLEDVRTKVMATDNPRLLIVFDSKDSAPGRGFKLKYKFLTDYAIPGTAINLEAKCHFLYTSVHDNHGSFNSPRHPSFYPDKTYCVYEFHGHDDESVRITFENFKVEGSPNCTKDYVEVFKYEGDGEESKEVIQVGRYCGERLPGPHDENVSRMKITLQTDESEVRTGFRARYEFIKKMRPNKRCHQNMTSGGAGVIESPNFPHKYTTNITCDWFIWAKSKQNRILLAFDMFSIEGNPNEKIGCGNAVLRVYASKSSLPTLEVCGEDKGQDHANVTSQTNLLRLKFVSTSKSTGGKGFRLSWTELLAHKNGKCPGFECVVSKFCIANSLKCDGAHNCGKNDDSDETLECGLRYTDSSALNIAIGVVCVLILVLVGSIVFFLCRRRCLRSKKKNVVNVRYLAKSPDPKRSAVAAGSPDDGGTTWQQKTEKISIL